MVMWGSSRAYTATLTTKSDNPNHQTAANGKTEDDSGTTMTVVMTCMKQDLDKAPNINQPNDGWEKQVDSRNKQIQTILADKKTTPKEEEDLREAYREYLA